MRLRYLCKATCPVAAGVLILAGCFAGIAQARVLAPSPEPGGGFVENPDKTWSLYGEGSKTPLRIYSSAERAVFSEYGAALPVEAGGVQSTSNVAGITASQEVRAHEMIEALQHDVPYANAGEAATGDALVAEAEAMGTLPTLGAQLAEWGPQVLAVGATFLTGIEIGNHIDTLFGLPTLSAELFGEKELPPPPEIRKDIYKHFYVGTGTAHLGIAKECKETISGYPHVSALLLATGSKWCMFPEVRRTEAETWEKNEGSKESPEWVSHSRGPEVTTSFSREGACVVSIRCPSGWWTTTREEHGTISSLFGPEVNYLNWFAAEGIHSPLHERAFPQKGLSSHWTNSPEGTVATPAPLEIPIPPKTEVPTRVNEHIAHEREGDELPGIEGDPEIKTPLWPTVPNFNHDELATDYKSRIETEGFTNVEITVRSEALEDPRQGPGDAVAVDPASGTRASPDTNIRVEANPGTAPAPVPGHGGIGPPTEPGMNLPHITVLCKSFPFGVPCWLVEQLEAWSAIGKAPVLGWPSMKIHGVTIPEVAIELAPLEPVMVKVRPFMIIFGTIAIVLLFYRFAMGGSPPAGDSTGDSADYSGMEGK